MRQSLGVVFALAAASLSGCFTAPADPAVGRYEARLPFTTVAGDDVVQLDVFLVERPAGDPCVNREAWELADEEVLKDRKSLLEENGLRACVLGDAPPDGLRELLGSERSCANPRRLRLHAGLPAQIVLGPPAARLRFRLGQEGRTADVELDEAQCLLQVTTRLTDDGRLNLQFAPQVRHGEAVSMPQPKREASGTLHWDIRTEQPTETYGGLSWELTVAPNTYVAVGTLLDRPDTLGQRAFLSAEAPRTQRLLVLRAGRALAGGPAEGAGGRQPPLASQAGWVAARGAGP